LSDVRLTPLLALLAAVALATIACAPSHGATYPGKFADAQRAETAGRYAEAAAKYDAAAKAATLERDRDYARYLAARMLLRAGNARDGVARLDEVAAASPPNEHSAEAAYQAASARIDNGDADRGWRDMEQVLTRFPDSGIAHSALRRLVVHKDEAGKKVALEWLEAQAKGPVGSGGVGELVSFQIAEHLASLESWSGAHDQFLATATRWPYPYGALWDDSLFRASEMDEKTSHPQHAIADLERMLVERETTSLVGSYQRPRMSPALFRIGLIYARDLHDREHARAAFHRLYTEFTTSKLRADALWFEASLWAEEGDAKTQCARLETLASDFPDSRYVPCVVEKCPSVKPAEKSKAPKTCHPYLLRTERLPS
jgi:outer membrane protein assembly factor BamD (BamD/ComL family)